MWDRMTGQLFTQQVLSIINIIIPIEKAKGISSLLPVNSVAVAAGNIYSVEQVAKI